MLFFRSSILRNPVFTAIPGFLTGSLGHRHKIRRAPARRAKVQQRTYLRPLLEKDFFT